jgi:dTDP-4-dehydrorhamnose reductase
MGTMSSILVTGSGGQLGKCLQMASGRYPELRFSFLRKSELDITDAGSVAAALKQENYDFCINTAAYNDVEEAERHPSAAYAVNSRGVEILARACKERGICLIHISTDYVFDGRKTSPYLPGDTPNPINEYGRSKLRGEQHISEILKAYYIIRTSWLYSETGSNFYTKILEKSRNTARIYVTDRQLGTPTNAHHLASFILELINRQTTPYGILHFAGKEEMTWFDFACKIIREHKLDGSVTVVRDNKNRSFAARPVYSVLKSKRET